MPGIGVISNPRSRTNRRDPGAARRLGYLIGSRGDAAATTSLDDLYRVAEAWKRADIDVLGINGGDGTIHHTLTAFIRTWGADKPLPPVAILRGGTMNTIANSLGIHGTPAKLLFELVDRTHAGEPLPLFPRRVIAVGDAYGFIFGNGVIYNFLDAYYKTGRPSPATAARLLARGLASAMVGGALARDLTRRLHARVTVDGDTWAREDFFTVACSSVEQVGLGFRPFYRCDADPEALQLLGIHAPTALSLAAELPRIHRGRPIRRDKCIDVLARDVRLEAERLDYIIDGDTYSTSGSLHLRPGPTLRLVRLTGQATGETPLPD